MALVITIPTVVALVEPSIIINMEPSQTTKPIQIKDNLGTEVFSVDVNGTIFPVQGAGSIAQIGNTATSTNIFVLTFEQVAEITQDLSLQASLSNDDFQQIAKWRVDFNGVQNEANPDFVAPTNVFNGQYSAHLRSSAGSNSPFNNSVEMFVMASDDDIDYSGASGSTFIYGGATSTSLYSAEFDEGFGFTPCAQRTNIESCFFAINWGTNDSLNGTAFAKNIRLDLMISIPQGATITQVVP